jgi:hypothetical protein
VANNGRRRPTGGGSTVRRGLPQELAGFRDGDPDAVRAVYREFGSLVFAVALRALGSRDLAEEATQQTFVKGRFGSERGVGV